MAIDVAISVPTKGETNIQFTACLLQLLSHTCNARRDVNCRFHFTESSILLQNRYNLVLFAKNGGCSHMLWLDDDMTFPPNTLVRLLDHDKEIVACNYTTRKIVAGKVLPGAISADAKTRISSKNRTGLEEVEHVGMGVMLTKMSVFEKVPVPYFYFGWAPKMQEFIGEDVWLSRKAREFGIKTYVDHDLSKEVGHIGKLEFNYAMVEDGDFPVAMGTRPETLGGPPKDAAA